MLTVCRPQCVFPDNERGLEGLQEACRKAKLVLKIYDDDVFFDDPLGRVDTPAAMPGAARL